MSRNGSGTMGILNTLQSGTTITASDHNENYSDIATEITNSVAADGQTTMSGPLKAASGMVGSPSITFGADTDTGIYRSASNEWSVAAGGAQIAKVSSSGIDAVSGRLLQAGAALVPAGSVVPYAGSTEPSGWLLCYGQAISRATYADLFTAVGTTYGAGDGSTTFNVPDYRGRVLAGKDDMGGSSANRLTNQSGGLNGDTLGATGGSETHTLTQAELPTIDIDAFKNDLGHVHGPGSGSAFATNAGPSALVTTGGGQSNAWTSTQTASATTGITFNDIGSDDPHNNVQPTAIVNYIIKT